MPKVGLRLALRCPHPGIYRNLARDAIICTCIEGVGGGRIAQSPDDCASQPLHLVKQDVQRTAYILADRLEFTWRSRAVTHTAVIETQYRNAGRSEVARKQHKLSMTADAVLRSTHDQQHADIRMRIDGVMQDAE